MVYSLEALSDSCYENSTVLVNKFNIRDSSQLDMIERNITSGLIAKAMIEIPFKNVDFCFYKNLHKYVFFDIYAWAGTVRKVEMSKKGANFCAAEKINQRADSIFNRLKKTDYLKAVDSAEFVNEFTELYCDLNYLHPFREGNGRIQRLFLNMLLANMDKSLDFSKIDKDLLLIATIKSVSGDVFALRDIFCKNITSSKKENQNENL